MNETLRSTNSGMYDELLREYNHSGPSAGLAAAKFMYRLDVSVKNNIKDEILSMDLVYAKEIITNPSLFEQSTLINIDVADSLKLTQLEAAIKIILIRLANTYDSPGSVLQFNSLDGNPEAAAAVMRVEKYDDEADKYYFTYNFFFSLINGDSNLQEYYSQYRKDKDSRVA